MAESASESDSSVVDMPSMMPPTMPPSPITKEQWNKRMESMQQQNKVLRTEVETYKLRVKSLQEENKSLRQASVNIQAKAEQEEEYISNTLLKKIQALKKEKETLALNYEQEEECLTNDLTRKLSQLRQEKVELEQTLEQEQECLVNKLMRKIEKLESETVSKQNALETLRREKIELENTLEQEQEAFVIKLWKKMDKLEAEKRMLQAKLEQPISNPPSPADFTHGDKADNLTVHVQHMRNEVARLKDQLSCAEEEHNRTTKHYAEEERLVKEENVRLQRKLQMEVERREALCRHLSESESSLEMEEERYYNEMASRHRVPPAAPSSPVPYPSPSSSRPLSPGAREQFNPITNRCTTCGQPVIYPNFTSPHFTSASPPSQSSIGYQRQFSRTSQERFVKPSAPAAAVSTTQFGSMPNTFTQSQSYPKPLSPLPKSPQQPPNSPAAPPQSPVAPPSPMDVARN